MDSSSPRQPPRSDHPPSLVLHSSWSGLAAAVVTPALLLAFAGWVVAARGARPFPLLLLAVAVTTTIAVLISFPRHSRLDADGITLARLGRRRHLSWSQVRAITRGPGTQAARTRALRDVAVEEEPPVSGGLVAVGAGRRRWLLTDQVESRAQFDALAALVRDLDPPVPMRAERPHAAAPPTDLYRRRRED